MIARGEIIYTPNVKEEDVAKVQAGMNAVTAMLGSPPYQVEDFALEMRDGEKSTGNLMGKIFWNWMYIDLLWVEPEFQKQGIGAALMQRAEAIARERNLTGIYCWTQSWQAPEFYRKLGYEEFTKIENLPPGHTRFGFRKYL